MENPPIQSPETIEVHEDCPRCHTANALVKQLHPTGEWAAVCPECGYQSVRKVVRNRKGEPLPTFDMKFQYSEETVEAYGMVDIHALNAETGDSYSVPTEKDFLDNIKPYIEANRELLEVATLSRYTGDTIEKINLLA
jgi:hypothetical protein